MLALPNGSKYYVISRATADSVLVLDNFFNITRRINLTQSPQTAALTPNGQRLLVLADTLRIFDTATDNEVTPPAPLGLSGVLTDLAVSQDSTRAYVLNSSSQQLAVVNLTTLTLQAPVPVPGNPTAVTVGPNDLVYVTAQNQIYEIDGRASAVRAQIPVNGQAGRLVFALDGSKAVAVNQIGVGGIGVFVLDPATRLVTTLSNSLIGGAILDRLVAAGNNRFFALSVAPRSLYDVNLGNSNIIAAAFGGLATTANAVGLVIPPNVPVQSGLNRYLYLLTTTNLHRIDLFQSQASGSVTLLSTPGSISLAGPNSSGSVSGFQQFNNNQTLASGATSLPLIVRAYDASGRPLNGVPVTFSAGVSGVGIQTPSTVTNSDGFAQTTITAPSAAASYPGAVTATIGNVLSASFSFTVGTGTPGSAAAFEITSGNGQILNPGSHSQPLVVTVRDSAGAPVANSQVTFSLTTGPGQGLLAVSGISGSHTLTTDSNGQASVRYVAPTTGIPANGFLQATITASNFAAARTFTITTAPTNPAEAPLRTIVLPVTGPGTLITGQAGQLLASAFSVRVVSGGGSSIQNVGISATTGQTGAGAV
ncbi:MAG: hypothetical protein FJW37_11910, partial [Acidobacteria bacterium]|nr:hypothetical protein [Acidobacteriota bacterium]